ncbi:MAG TPA: hypoxanthine phosphoribosyltransferase, partial [Bacteroidetes bacterium]|nr:hypoxanthine phosphoribosyltransferase [Bacteroidota bacterium]
MASIQLHDKVFKPYIDRKEVEAIIDKMANDISNINNNDLLVVIVLNGSMFFATELLQRINRPWEIDTMRLASYHGGLQSSGQVEFLLDVKAKVSGRNVLLVEDIVDTGRTLAFLHDHFKGLGAQKIMTA